MCQILHVSVSGYYKYRRNLGKPGKDAILSAAMQEILDESPYNDNYGAPRMQIALFKKELKQEFGVLLGSCERKDGSISRIANPEVLLMLQQKSRNRKI